jgi:alpha-L-fucosidase
MKKVMMAKSVSIRIVLLIVVGVVTLSSSAFAAECCKKRSIWYEPKWQSFKKYQVPEWYLDAKFGIFIHWGVYSVPAFDNEWYPRHMYIDERAEEDEQEELQEEVEALQAEIDSTQAAIETLQKKILQAQEKGDEQKAEEFEEEVKALQGQHRGLTDERDELRERLEEFEEEKEEEEKEQNDDEEEVSVFDHHRKKYGPQSKFGYKDFIPLFQAENWNPDEWAELFKNAGAKYVVPVAEHHDGFPMYDCSYTKWNAVNMGPKRDTVGELAAACRRRGLKFGVSSHRAFNWNYYTFRGNFDTLDKRYWGLYGKPHPKNAPHSKEFLDDWYARTIELIDKYKPDLLWFDFGIIHEWFEPYRKKITAYYYNKALQWGQEVALNYKSEAFPAYAAVLDVERGRLAGIRKQFWQTDTSVCHQSWGYIHDHKYKSVDYLIDELVDIVSKNGCLLLNIAPKPDGTIPEQQRRILLEIGRWLQTNGEAIYGSRYWKVSGEGPTETVEGSMQEEEDEGFEADDIRFTVEGDVLYAICLGWPGKSVTIKTLADRRFYGLFKSKIKSITMLGDAEELEWKLTRKGLVIKTPEKKPCEHAFVFKIAR